MVCMISLGLLGSMAFWIKAHCIMNLGLDIGVKWRVQDTENRGVMGDSSQLD